MKKLILLFIVSVMVAGMVFGDSGIKISDVTTSKDWIPYNLTLPTANTTGVLTISAGAVYMINLRARGGDIRWTKTDSTSAAFWTIGDNETFNPDLPFPLGKDTSLYFWSTTALVTLDAWVSYR